MGVSKVESGGANVVGSRRWEGRTGFRTEAVENISDARYGQVLLSSPPVYKLMLVMVGGAMAGLLVFLGTANMASTSVARGELVPEQGTLLVGSRAQGVLSGVLVKEGDWVKAGQVLATVDSERVAMDGRRGDKGVADALNARVQAVDEDLRRGGDAWKAKLQGLRLETEAANGELAAAQERMRVQGERVALARRSVKEVTEMMDKGYVSVASAREREAALLEQIGRLRELEMDVASRVREVSRLTAAARNAEADWRRDANEGAIRRADAESSVQEHELRRGSLILAPADGKVAAIHVNEGAGVATGRDVFTLLGGQGGMTAVLYVPSKAARGVRIGTDVLLRCPALPFQKYGQIRAKVTRVAEAALSWRDVDALTKSANASREGETYLRVVARLVGTGKAVEDELKAGFPVEASIVADRRTIAEWMLEPLLAIREKRKLE